MFNRVLLLSVSWWLVMGAASLLAETGQVIALWETGAPGFEERKGEPELAESYWVKNIHNPSITAYFPDPEIATGAAVIICPGGGHRELVFNAEGVQAAEYFNRIGVAAFALKYRLGREEGSPYDIETHARQDGQRAVRLVRSRAEQWGIDPTRIGMMGFSAGGEVVSLVSYGPDNGVEEDEDEVERQSCRPNFQILIYPGPLGVPEELPETAPPAFLLVANDDVGASKVVVDLIPKFRAAGVPMEAHLYARGGHAFNMGDRSKLTTLQTWPDRVTSWMTDNFWLDPTGREGYAEELEKQRQWFKLMQERRRAVEAEKPDTEAVKPEPKTDHQAKQSVEANDSDAKSSLPKLISSEAAQTLVSDNCYSCHGDGEREGGVALDELWSNEDVHVRKETWHRVLKQLRSGLMPPREESPLPVEQVAALSDWIKHAALELDPQRPSPGAVTIRRLNRTEYRNTIRDLLGVDFDSEAAFPADDTGHGFDNIGDVLSLTPLLLEKYLAAARVIVTEAVPASATVMRTQAVSGRDFHFDTTADKDTDSGAEAEPAEPAERRDRGRNLKLSYYLEQSARATADLEFAGNYIVRVKFKANESYVDNVFDDNRCELTISLDGETLLQREFVRQGGKEFVLDFDRELASGAHDVVMQVRPLSSEEQVRDLRFDVEEVEFVGPREPEFYVKPANYDRAFPQPVPEDADARLEYARALLETFATRAFRRPVDPDTVERLVTLVEAGQASGKTFESGVSDAMVAVLASPRFLFREEFRQPGDASRSPLIDEFSLASRMSYFLWSTMPDAELIRLAEKGELRSRLTSQLERMLADEKSSAFFENFTGQWLRSQEVDGVDINARSVARREAKPDPEGDERRRRFFELFRRGDERTEAESVEFEELSVSVRSRFRAPQVELTDGIRRAMRRETEMLFEHLVREDRPLVELLDCNYTFLNEELAEFYEIEGVEGRFMRRVELAPDSMRGGVLTHGSFLAITSNPDRTSPVKRGLFVLENLLGLSTGAPPPDIPSLESALEESAEGGPPPSLRESLAVHRQDALCSSCHNRMDPLGLALENFNALGRYRDQEFQTPIDASGELMTGETFQDVRELKGILASNRSQDFYYCLTEKLLTYALGRAVDYQDVLTQDAIVAELARNEGRAAGLLAAIVNSDAFQRMEVSEAPNGQVSRLAK